MAASHVAQPVLHMVTIGTFPLVTIDTSPLPPSTRKSEAPGRTHTSHEGWDCLKRFRIGRSPQRGTTERFVRHPPGHLQVSVRARAGRSGGSPEQRRRQASGAETSARFPRRREKAAAARRCSATETDARRVPTRRSELAGPECSLSAMAGWALGTLSRGAPADEPGDWSTRARSKIAAVANPDDVHFGWIVRRSASSSFLSTTFSGSALPETGEVLDHAVK